MKIIVVLASRSFIYYVINVYVPRVRANAYQALTTPPRVFRDPKMCLRNIWTAPKVSVFWGGISHYYTLYEPVRGQEGPVGIGGSNR